MQKKDIYNVESFNRLINYIKNSIQITAEKLENITFKSMVTDCIDDIGRHIVFHEKNSKKLPVPKSNGCFDIFISSGVLDLW